MKLVRDFIPRIIEEFEASQVTCKYHIADLVEYKGLKHPFEAK